MSRSALPCSKLTIETPMAIFCILLTCLSVLYFRINFGRHALLVSPNNLCSDFSIQWTKFKKLQPPISLKQLSKGVFQNYYQHQIKMSVFNQLKSKGVGVFQFCYEFSCLDCKIVLSLPAFPCSKLTTETLEKVLSKFQVNNKDTMASLWCLYC